MHDPAHSIHELVRRDRRYKFDAYVFIFEALSFAQSVLGMGTPGESEPSGEPSPEPPAKAPERHVTGQELCEAIRQYAVQQYGLMAQMVLNSWGLRTTGDFGEIVFNLIEIGEMRKTKNDRREDFDNVFDFDVAFRREFKLSMS